MVGIQNNYLRLNVTAKHMQNSSTEQVRSGPIYDINKTSNIYDLFNAKGNEVNISEALKLITQGCIEKTGEIFKAIVKHPVQVAGAVGITTIGLSFLPLIGISSLTGSALLSTGFAGIAIYKTAKDVYKAVKDNKNGDIVKLRHDLKNIGGDSLELLLSLPFLPKSLSQIKNQIKYSPGIKFNTGLLNTLKETKGIWNKAKELTKADLKILYKIQTGELGLKVAPDLKFEDLQEGLTGGYNFQTGNILIANKEISPLKLFELNSFLKHELTHFKQASEIVRLPNGIDLLENSTISRITQNELKIYKATAINTLKSKKEQLASIDKSSDTAKILNAEIKSFNEYLKLINNNPKLVIYTTRPSVIKNTEEQLRQLKSQSASLEIINKYEQALNYYKQDPGINRTFYEDVIRLNHKPLTDKKVAIGYLKAYRDYPKEIFKDRLPTKDYISNPLEKEAYQVQGQYLEQVKLLEFLPVYNAISAIANIADNPK